jgi:hypothetical protein
MSISSEGDTDLVIVNGNIVKRAERVNLSLVTFSRRFALTGLLDDTIIVCDKLGRMRKEASGCGLFCIISRLIIIGRTKSQNLAG